jgi:putative FmdB family regulatory protein
VPVYTYRCMDCRHTYDQQRHFIASDDPCTCPSCGSENTIRVFAAVLVFVWGAQTTGSFDARRSCPNPGSSTCASCGR